MAEIEVITGIKPKNDGAFSVTDVRYVKGSYQSVADSTARDNIAPNRRSVGMLVQLQSTGKSYRLVGGVTNSNWVEEYNNNTYYNHYQSTAASSWIIVHGLGYNPSVNIIHISGYIVQGTLSYPSGGLVARVDFNKSFGGTGYCS